MRVAFHRVSAFVGATAGGNPAVICPLESWLPDEIMQEIAAENNVSETAFLVREGSAYRLRWFTPTLEVALCGHATLGAAWVIFERVEPGRDRVVFRSGSGTLPAWRDGERIHLDFPADAPRRCQAPAALLEGLSLPPREVWSARDYMAVYDTEEDIRRLAADPRGLCRLDKGGVIVTAAGRDADFVSRYFAPREGLPEDPVTGSAHCTLAPYWAARLGRTDLRALQLSARGGEVGCALRGGRVILSGRVAAGREEVREIRKPVRTAGARRRRNRAGCISGRDSR